MKPRLRIRFVGFPCREICAFRGLPDMHRVNGIISLRTKCRKCRVLNTAESPQEIRQILEHSNTIPVGLE
jgi:hypothetical protein